MSAPEIRFAPNVELPAELKIEAYERLAEAFASIDALPRGGQLLRSVEESALTLRIGDWTCVYTMDLIRHRVTVVHASERTRAA